MAAPKAAPASKPAATAAKPAAPAPKPAQPSAPKPAAPAPAAAKPAAPAASLGPVRPADDEPGDDDITKIDGASPGDKPLTALKPEEEPAVVSTKLPLTPPSAGKPLGRVEPKKTVLGMGAVTAGPLIAPTKSSATGREASGKIDLRSANAPKETSAKEASAKVVVAAVAKPNAAAPGPMEDPSHWFDESSVKKPPSTAGDQSGAVPLPPPPQKLEPLPHGEITGEIPLPPPRPPIKTDRLPQPSTIEEKTPPRGVQPLPAEFTPATVVEGPKSPPAPAPTSPALAATLAAPTAATPASAPRSGSSAPTMMGEGPKLAEAPKSEPPKARISGVMDAPPLPPPPSMPAPLAPQSTMVTRAPSASGVMAPMAAGKSRTMLYAAIGGGALLVLVIGGILIASSGSSKKAPVPAPVARPEPPPAPAPEAPAPAPAHEPAVAKPAPTPKPAPVEEAAIAPTPSPTPPPEPRTTRTHGGHKVVVDYDNKAGAETPPPAPTPQGEDPAVVARARETYRRGNSRLFAGDSEGAVTAYRQSITIYPGYMAGYRGLGLAYAEQGNVDEALKALKTYVKTVPNARDVPMIQRRIQHLEGAK
jgi:hypothetical protein